MRHEKLLTEEKCMQSSIDTTISMLSPTNSPQSAFTLKKKEVLVHFNWSERMN